MDKDISAQLPEAPASVTARVISNKGFRLLFTLRDTTIRGLIDKFEQFQDAVLSKGWIPEQKYLDRDMEREVGNNGKHKFQSAALETSKPRSSKTTSESAICPVCGAAATKKSGYRKDGTLWEGIFCSTGDESHKAWLS